MVYKNVVFFVRAKIAIATKNICKKTTVGQLEFSTPTTG